MTVLALTNLSNPNHCTTFQSSVPVETLLLNLHFILVFSLAIAHDDILAVLISATISVSHLAVWSLYKTLFSNNRQQSQNWDSVGIWHDHAISPLAVDLSVQGGAWTYVGLWTSLCSSGWEPQLWSNNLQTATIQITTEMKLVAIM